MGEVAEAVWGDDGGRLASRQTSGAAGRWRELGEFQGSGRGGALMARRGKEVAGGAEARQRHSETHPGQRAGGRSGAVLRDPGLRAG